MGALKRGFSKYFGDMAEWRRIVLRLMILMFETVFVLSCIKGIRTGRPVLAICFGAGAFALVLVYYLAGRLKDCQNLYMFFLLPINVLVVPGEFVGDGGVESGMSMSLLLAMILVFLLLDGWRFYVTLAATISADIAAYAYCFMYPEKVTLSVSLDKLVILSFTYFIFSSLTTGLVIKLVLYHLDEERRLSEERKKEIEKISDSKSMFLARMSHEIRTPINAVLGMNEMILRESEDENILDYAANAYNSGKTLLSIINDILDISKIEAGRLEAVETEYDLYSLISDCYNMTANRADRKGLAFYVNCDENLPSRFRGDMFHIRQIVVNFITNAVKYTDTGFVTLKISGKRVDEDFMLSFSVSDSGIGLKPENMEKLFTSFQRFDMERNQSVEGTGLGLSICKQLSDLLGGKVFASSEYGKGSTFGCTIPQKVISDTPVGKITLKHSAGIKDDAADRHFSAEKADILVVDDVDMNIIVFKSLMKEHRLNIDEALSGRACLDRIRKKKYDIIFMDHMMPEMDGMETYELMKKTEHLNSDTPVIMLTANALFGERKKYMDAGFAACLTKPVTGEKLREALLSFLPAEKIIWENAAGTKDVNDVIDLRLGLSYAGNNENAYTDILSGYVDKGPDNIEKLNKLSDREAWDEYTILVHALKSTSMTIGAEKLSMAAGELEAAGKAEDYPYMKDNNDKLISLYRDVIDAGNNILKSRIGKTSDSCLDVEPGGKDKKTILVVDDDEINLLSAENALGSLYNVVKADSGENALGFLGGNTCDLILLDLVMPGMDGLEVMEKLRADTEYREIPVIFLTADTKAETENRCLSAGAVDYIQKPFSAEVLRARIGRILELFDLRNSLQQKVHEKTVRIENLSGNIINALAHTIDAKDRYTSGHSLRVAEYSRLIAERMGKSREEQDEIYQAGLLHDVGKIRVPAAVINKSGKLDDDEFELMKLHPITGYHILREISDEKLFSEGARFHHERFDGKGYPSGLSGKQIPEIARIVGVADAYDAMTSNRSYRSALPQDIVRAEIEKGSGTQFDPEIAGLMLELMDEDKEYGMREGSLADKRILVVDDEPVNITIIESLLKDSDIYTVKGCESGAEALEALRDERFDIVLLDVNMYGMDGYETAEKIRRLSDIPIVFMTADKTLIGMEELKTLNIADFITKPFKPAMLMEILHSVLG